MFRSFLVLGSLTTALLLSGLSLLSGPGEDLRAAEKPAAKKAAGQRVQAKAKGRGKRRHTSRLSSIPGDGNPNWMAATFWHNTTGTPISSFTTTWVVPQEPTNKTLQHVLFLFNGLEPDDFSTILQPVLQWGSDSLDGVTASDGWYVASWYVGASANPAVSRAVKVNPGDRLVGTMNLLGRPTPTNPSFSYECFFSRFVGGKLVPLSDTRLQVPGQGAFGDAVSNVPELKWAVETLEAYGPGGAVLTACDAYPPQDKTTMGAIAIKTGASVGSISWTPQPNPLANCGQHAVPNADGSVVDLWYHAESAAAKASIKKKPRPLLPKGPKAIRPKTTAMSHAIPLEGLAFQPVMQMPLSERRMVWTNQDAFLQPMLHGERLASSW
jgi:hypothetical protein